MSSRDIIKVSLLVYSSYASLLVFVMNADSKWMWVNFWWLNGSATRKRYLWSTSKSQLKKKTHSVRFLLPKINKQTKYLKTGRIKDLSESLTVASVLSRTPQPPLSPPAFPFFSLSAPAITLVLITRHFSSRWVPPWTSGVYVRVAEASLYPRLWFMSALASGSVCPTVTYQGENTFLGAPLFPGGPLTALAVNSIIPTDTSNNSPRSLYVCARVTQIHFAAAIYGTWGLWLVWKKKIKKLRGSCLSCFYHLPSLSS